MHGISIPPHHGSVSLQQLVAGEGMPPLRLSAPPLVDLPNGPGSTLACLQLAALLVDRRARPVRGDGARPERARPRLGRRDRRAAGRQAPRPSTRGSSELRRQLNVYRGHVLDVSVSRWAAVALTFGDAARDRAGGRRAPRGGARPGSSATRSGVAAHRDALLARRPASQARAAALRAARHRQDAHDPLPGRADDGLHAAACSPAARCTRSGRRPSSRATCSRPSIVLEDVDLVAEDRSFGPGSSPVLFDLLDAMDGAAADADLLFVLTTNRADLLEPALAARPGRVDVAVEIALPDAEARGRLLALYARSVPAAPVATRDSRRSSSAPTGVTASFLKELLRRAVLESLHEDARHLTVTAAHTSRALDDLLDERPAADAQPARRRQRSDRPCLPAAAWAPSLRSGGGAGSATVSPARLAASTR